MSVSAWCGRAQSRRTAFLGSACALLFLLAACGEGRNKGGGQVVASVNGTEITVHQVDYELARARSAGAARDDKAFKRALEALIDQQLVVERAEADKLDRDPQVLQALEQSRRQVLGQAYLERSLGAAQPSADEIRTFYLENPALFQKRRIYSFRDFVVDRASFTDEVRGKLEDPRVWGDLGGALRKANVSYRETTTTRNAEHLPMESLARIAAMSKGEISVILNDQSALLMQLVDAADQPLTLEQAMPFIEQYLINARRKRSIEAKLKELRASARITYSGLAAGTAGDPVNAPERKTAIRPPDSHAPAVKAVVDEQPVQKGMRSVVEK